MRSNHIFSVQFHHNGLSLTEQEEVKEVKKNSLWGTAVVFLFCKSYTTEREVDRHNSRGESETR